LASSGPTPTPPTAGALALIDYDRLRPGVEALLDGRFNLPLVNRMLGTLHVTTTFLATSSAADKWLVEVAARFGFFSILAEPKSEAWMGHALRCEEARARRFGARDLVLLGATAAEVEGIQALQAGGASVTTAHWPGAFDLELVRVADHSISLGPDFVINAPTMFAHLLSQAT
jgi:hypothetical protein